MTKIYKVQISIPNRESVLIYDKTKNYLLEYPAEKNKELLKLLEGRWKAFFKGHLDENGLTIDNEAPDQGW